MNETSGRPENPSHTWVSHGPAFRNRTVLISFGAVTTISIGFVALLLLGMAVAEEHYHAVPGILGLVVLLWLGFTFFFYLIGFIFFGRTVPMEVTVDDKGITQTMRSKTSTVVNALSMLAAFAGNSRGFTTAGAGMIAQSRQTEFVQWRWISELRLQNPRTREYQVRNHWRPLLVLHLPEEREEEIVSTINQHIAAQGLKDSGNEIPTGIRVILVLLAIVLGGYLLLPFPVSVPPLLHLAIPFLAVLTVLLPPRVRTPLGWLLFAGTGVALLYSWQADPPGLSRDGVGVTIAFQMALYFYFILLGLFAGFGKLTPHPSTPNHISRPIHE